LQIIIGQFAELQMIVLFDYFMIYSIVEIHAKKVVTVFSLYNIVFS